MVMDTECCELVELYSGDGFEMPDSLIVQLG